MAKKSTVITGRTQMEILKSMPSALFLSAHMRHAGVHADQNRKSDPRQRRRRDRQDERRARMGDYD